MLVCLALIAAQLIWMGVFLARLDEQDIRDGWMLLFYNLALVDAIMLPLTVAVLASRNGEAEHRGMTFKLLETLITPGRLYAAKLCWGALTLGALLILRGVAWRHAAWCAAAVLAMGLLFVLTNPYAMRRLVGFLCPDADPTGSGWHIRQFQLAIAHGHWFGAKLGQAFWSNAYLPLAYNDSAYATMAETLGFSGTMPVPAFFVVLFYFLMYDAGREDLQAGARFYLAGAALMLAIQALIHISVNVGLLPPTGLTLPFISYGGSSMIGGCLIIGLALSARHAVRTPSCPKLSKRAVPEE